MNKKICATALVACLAASVAGAQELNKEITLEKDFVPVEKKVTKKNTLPRVKKVNPPAKTTLDYSDTPVTIDVPTTIPTMAPYGYRTAHNFSDKRGYLEVGGGLAANFDGSAGYRFVDTQNTQAGLWVQHNSTWNGKNRSSFLEKDEYRAKQVFNDNRGGLYLTNHVGGGTLRLDADVHFDSFNYYGARKDYDDFDAEKKQSLLEFNVGGGWKHSVKLGDAQLPYRVNVAFNHTGYDFLPQYYAISPKQNGTKQSILNFGVGADYSFEDYGTVSLDVKGDYVNYKGASGESVVSGYDSFRINDKDYFILTVSPRYKWENEVFRAQAGVDLVVGDINNAYITRKFNVAPFIKLDVDVVDGAAIYVDVKGGNTINSLSRMASLDRYADPAGLSNTWRPFDGEFGFKVGPFGGFSAKLFGGYAMSRGEQLHNNNMYVGGPAYYFNYNAYMPYKMRGFKLGAELNYKYRSLVEAAAAVTYAPGDKETIDPEKWVKGYALGLDGARLVANLDFKVTPIRQLAINLGMDYRGDRHFLGDQIFYQDLDDAFNLYAGASWRFDKSLTLWARASNLLNRRYDVLPGQGAQGINAMLGVSLVF